MCFQRVGQHLSVHGSKPHSLLLVHVKYSMLCKSGVLPELLHIGDVSRESSGCHNWESMLIHWGCFRFRFQWVCLLASGCLCGLFEFCDVDFSGWSSGFAYCQMFHDLRQMLRTTGLRVRPVGFAAGTERGCGTAEISTLMQRWKSVECLQCVHWWTVHKVSEHFQSCWHNMFQDRHSGSFQISAASEPIQTQTQLENLASASGDFSRTCIYLQLHTSSVLHTCYFTGCSSTGSWNIVLIGGLFV